VCVFSLLRGPLMYREVVYDFNKRKHNSHNSFYLYTHHCWDLQSINSFRACFTMYTFGTHWNYQEIKIILPVSQTLQVIKHYCNAN
jgi:hypothetical protein